MVYASHYRRNRNLPFCNTKAIVLKDDFIEARLLRAEALVQMQQYKEAMEDIDTILAQDPEDELSVPAVQ